MLQAANNYKSMSLLERKRQQWAQERAEMESLQSHWGLPSPAAYNIHLSESRSRYASSLEIRSTCPVAAQKDLLPRRQRSPSLPPIWRSTQQDFVSQDDKQSFSDNKRSNIGTNKYTYEEAEGETSGYASEVAPHASPEPWRKKQETKHRSFIDEVQRQRELGDQSLHIENNQPMTAWQFERGNNDFATKKRSYKEASEGDGDTRPKWGDRGVAVGRLWDPQEVDQRLPQGTTAKSPPSWMERGLSSMDHNTDSQLFLLETMSSSSSVENYDAKHRNFLERPTHLLGQNVPIESCIKAERESRRVKALELQAAIILQLEERELMKRTERERRIKEEREEEERFKKQKDLEMQRIQEEKKLAEEKRQRENKRSEALRQALEKAEQQAKLEKENQRINKLRGGLSHMSLVPNSQQHNTTQMENSCKEYRLVENTFVEKGLLSPRKEHNTTHRQVEAAAKQMQQCVSSENHSAVLLSSSHSAKYQRSLGSCSRAEIRNQEKLLHSLEHAQNVTSTINGNLAEPQINLVPASVTHDSIFTPMHITHANGMQMAFLLPQHVFQCLHPIAVHPVFPSDLHINRNYYSATSQTDADETSMTYSDKITMLSKNRNTNCQDASTQTDASTLPNLDEVNKNEQPTAVSSLLEMLPMNLSQQHSSEEKLNMTLNKKEKRPSSDDKVKEIENRPKWGVNKPPTQYKKQSEKDIFFPQRRKMRSRKRIEEKQQYSSHSSDENMSPPPLDVQKTFSPKIDRNRIQPNVNYWKRNSDIKMGKALTGGQNINAERTEISQLECDKSGIVTIICNTTLAACDQTNKLGKQPSAQPKRLSLSQKFMNDKYGNPKIYNSNLPSEDRKLSTGHVKCEDKEYSNTNKFKDESEKMKYLTESISRARGEQSKYYSLTDAPSLSPRKPVILDQLKSLKYALKKQQREWRPSETEIESTKSDIELNPDN